MNANSRPKYVIGRCESCRHEHLSKLIYNKEWEAWMCHLCDAAHEDWEPDDVEDHDLHTEYVEGCELCTLRARREYNREPEKDSD